MRLLIEWCKGSHEKSVSYLLAVFSFLCLYLSQRPANAVSEVAGSVMSLLPEQSSAHRFMCVIQSPEPSQKNYHRKADEFLFTPACHLSRAVYK